MIALRRYSPVPGSMIRPLMEPLLRETVCSPPVAWAWTTGAPVRPITMAAAKDEYLNFDIVEIPVNRRKKARHGGHCARSPKAKGGVGYSAGSGQSRLLHEPRRRIDAHPERGVPSWSLAAPGAIDRNPPLPERPMANDQKTNPNRHDTPDHANQKKGEDS